MNIKIIQGNGHVLPQADINIVIDVIRAFTVAHYAFLSGVQKIILVHSVDQAFHLKREHPEFLLAGEVNGLPIKGFELDNSPHTVSTYRRLNGETLVQKTTNGVKATMNALNASHIIVTGYSNAQVTANYVKKLCEYGDVKENTKINIVASHPTGDDDLACAEYMKGIIEGDAMLHELDVEKRIRESHVVPKFLNPERPEFKEEDIEYCAKALKSDFVMRVRVNQSGGLPWIERENV